MYRRLDRKTSDALRLVEKDPMLLVGFDEKIRGNVEVVLKACKKNHMAVKYATKDLWQDAGFMYVSQDFNPKKLKALLEKHPYITTPQLASILAVYEDPLAFTEIPTEAFLDKRFINLCKHAIGFRLKEIIGDDVPSKSEIGLANTIYRFVRETEDLRALELGKSDKMTYEVKPKSARGIIHELTSI